MQMRILSINFPFESSRQRGLDRYQNSGMKMLILRDQEYAPNVHETAICKRIVFDASHEYLSAAIIK